MIEGVAYSPFLVRWRDPASGARRQLTLWSPGHPWLAAEVSRALTDLDVPAGTTVRIASK